MFFIIFNAIVFSYPTAMQGHIQNTLPYMFGDDQYLRDTLTISSMFPLLLIPGSVSVAVFFQDRSRYAIQAAHTFLVIGALSMVFDNMFFPSFNWYAAQALLQVNISSGMIHLIGGMNSFVHVYIGEYLRWVCFGAWALIISIMGIRERLLPRWLTDFGILIAVAIVVLLIVRVLVASPWLIDHGLNFIPVFQLWVFLLAFCMLSGRKESI